MARVFLAASSESLIISEAPVTGPPFTVTFWFYPTTVGVAQTMFWLGDLSEANQFFSVGLNATDHLTIFVQQTLSSQEVATSATVTVNTWHHATAIFESDIVRRISLDNQTEATGIIDLGPTGVDGTAWARRGDSSPDQYFDGYLFWGSISNEILPAAAKAPFANGASPLHYRREHLKRFYPFIADEDIDLITGKSLSVVGTPTVLAVAPSGLLSPTAYALPPKGYWSKGSIDSGISLKT